MMRISPRIPAFASPSLHQSMKSPMVSCSLSAGTTIDSSGSATSPSGMSSLSSGSCGTVVEVIDKGPQPARIPCFRKGAPAHAPGRLQVSCTEKSLYGGASRSRVHSMVVMTMGEVRRAKWMVTSAT